MRQWKESTEMDESLVRCPCFHSIQTLSCTHATHQIEASVHISVSFLIWLVAVVNRQEWTGNWTRFNGFWPPQAEGDRVVDETAPAATAMRQYLSICVCWCAISPESPNKLWSVSIIAARPGLAPNGCKISWCCLFFWVKKKKRWRCCMFCSK